MSEEVMNKEKSHWDNKTDELLLTLQGQRHIVGDKVMRIMINTAIRAGHMKANDKSAYDEAIKNNKALQEFMKDVGCK